MSNCLDDARVQTVADGEGTAAEMAHLASCAGCEARVSNAHAAVVEFGHQMSELPVPPALGARVVAAAAQGRAPDARRGATTMRAVPRTLPRPAWVFAGGAVAALVFAGISVLFPSVDPSARLSAAEILDRSLQTLSRQGVELLEYELSIDAPSTLPEEHGTFRIEQLIDHDSGRWRFARFAPDGTLVNGISEDPSSGIREVVLRVEGRTVVFRFTIAPDRQVKLWDVQRRYAETMIRLIQASAGQNVTEETAGDQKRYVIALPNPVRAFGNAAGREAPALFDLDHARVVVDASDYHVVEFSAAGAAMGQPVSIGFRLIQRVVGASATGSFELPHDGAAIQLSGEGTDHVPSDLFSLLLREVAAR